MRFISEVDRCSHQIALSVFSYLALLMNFELLLQTIPSLSLRDDLLFSSYHKASIHYCNWGGRLGPLSLTYQLNFRSQKNRTQFRVAKHLGNQPIVLKLCGYIHCRVTIAC